MLISFVKYMVLGFDGSKIIGPILPSDLPDRTQLSWSPAAATLQYGLINHNSVNIPAIQRGYEQNVQGEIAVTRTTYSHTPTAAASSSTAVIPA